jgi:ketosteroid isomerase-like protein
VSEENADQFVHALEHFNRTGEVFEPAFDPACEYHTATDLPDSTVFRGIGAYRRFVREWRDSFDDLHVDIDRVVEQGDYVVVAVTLTGRIHGTDEEVAMPESYLARFRDGKAVELREYRTTEAALAEVGAAD